MVVELISVGTEILLGNIVNTNTQYLAEKCALLGLSMYHQVTVGDNRERLFAVLETALNRSDVVILTGGLGPTEDDLTKEVCAEVMGFDLVEDEHTRERISKYFKNNIYKEIPDNNWKQAMIPQGATVLDNSNGTAPGLIMEKDGKTAILLPGPPNELKPLFTEQVFPYLQSRQPEVIRSQMVKICGYGESQVEDKLIDLINTQTNPTIATYAKTAEVHLRVTAKAANEEEAKTLLKPVVKEIKNRFDNAVYTTKEEETLEMAVVRLLKKHELTVTTAESCTGGLIAGRLVNVPGASEVFREGFITYSNKAKRKYLDVSKGTLKKYGAVSEQTAKEMATGGVFASDADACIAVTGIAGPDADGEKPVGLVYIACYMKDKVKVEEYHFKGNREKIREQSVVKALDFLRRSILSNYH
ncbi:MULTISPECIES: competence/damage-inducible protein A [Lacrimispora]|uniref:Putative competence-damage inducible protein n=1 Tax=Lacrimispora defluvii TaxID=2719233 RepID=A0ABX1VW17_9FIRM|nr:competence/damage-inducible protein A [Lacrimispora defluvii]MBE5976898.1 competence/damage-inducible protein A [Paenibacillaceae bacterium]NNJ32531.1 competence/damage-inducible protein A [Lacrimispora defluvii]